MSDTADDLYRMEEMYSTSYPPSLWGGGAVAAAPMALAPSYALPEDPDHFTIAQIEEWVMANGEQADEVLAAEQARGDSARVTLIGLLESFITDRDAEAPEP